MTHVWDNSVYYSRYSTHTKYSNKNPKCLWAKDKDIISLSITVYREITTVIEAAIYSSSVNCNIKTANPLID